MIIDCFTFNGEYDLLEIRLNILHEYVDQFIICEAETTFSGQPKPLYYRLQELRYKKFWPKIKYFVIDESYTHEEIALAESSPNTLGADHWKHEFLQKESIKKALVHLNDDDIVFIGDVDEIWHPGLFIDSTYIQNMSRHQITRIGCVVYTYYLNNRSTEDFTGGLVTRYANVKDACLNHLRTSPPVPFAMHGAWHFTSMGGYSEVRRKLNDSYTDQSYASIKVMQNLEQNIAELKDFLGRNFTYHIDESDWPQWLKKHKMRYSHLLR